MRNKMICKERAGKIVKKPKPIYQSDLFEGHKDIIQKAIKRLKTFEPEDGYYLAFSGGKDSCVILALAKMAGVKYDAHYKSTGIDPPELLRFIKKHHPGVKWHYPKMNIWQLMEKKKIPPTRVIRYCCRTLKEAGGKGRLIMTGVRWGESHRRSKRRLIETCFRDKSKQFMNVIIEWTDSEVWRFIKENNIEYCSLYDEGFTRLGCIGCPMGGKGREKEFKRWPRFKELWFNGMKRIIKAQKASDLITNRKEKGFETADELWAWWMSNAWRAENPDQLIFFE